MPRWRWRSQPHRERRPASRASNWRVLPPGEVNRLRPVEFLLGGDGGPPGVQHPPQAAGAAYAPALGVARCFVGEEGGEREPPGGEPDLVVGPPGTGQE